MDRSTLENSLVDPENGRGLVDGTYDNVPNFKDVLRQQSLFLKHQDDASTADSKFSESTNVPRRNLRVHDVAALILNKVVGSGIFTTPGLVLALTKDKTTSIVLWVIGGIHAMLCLTVYLEFGTALPFTGGELIYLNEIFRKPKLLATILFSGFFILLQNTSGNAIAFAKHVLLAANPDTNSTTELDSRLINLVAVGILSIICLLHYFSRRLGLFLNTAFALFKVFLLAAVFIAGAMARHKNDSGMTDFKTKHEGANGKDSLAAFIYIIYSYQGWENANYVAGEIKAPKKTLRWGAFIAMGTVTLLYVLVTVGYYLACDYATIIGQNSDLGVAISFAPKAFGNSRGIKIAIALSAAGNLIAVVFTASKVKQAIAIQRIIPFYRFLQKDDQQFNTPVGGIVLHWVFSLIIIVCTPNNADGYGFMISLFTYGHILTSVFVGIGIFSLHQRMNARNGGWKLSYLTHRPVLYCLATIFIGINCVVLVVSALPQKRGTIPRWWWPAITAMVLGASFLYWSGFTALQMENPFSPGQTVGAAIGFEIIVHQEDDESIPDKFSKLMVQARNDGSARRIEYRVTGRLKRLLDSLEGIRAVLGRYVW